MAVTICKYSSSTDQITGFLSGVDLYADYPAEPSHLIPYIFNLRFIVLTRLFLCLISLFAVENIVGMRIISLSKALMTSLAELNQLKHGHNSATVYIFNPFWLLFLPFNVDDLFGS